MDNIVVMTEHLERKEWLAYRNKGIGGSDVSTICGMNKFKSVMELWLEKTNQLPLQETENEFAYWGTVLEPIVRKEFTKRTGFVVKEKKYMLQHPKYKFMFANLDGVIKDENGELCIFEAKTASVYKALEWDNQVPVEYQLQIQHYMAVTGYRKTYIAVLIGGNTYKYFEVARDDELIDLIIQMELKFWNHVTNNIPPEIDGSNATSEYLNKYFQVGKKEVTTLPLDAVDYIRVYEETNNHIKALTERKEEMANKLKFLLKDFEEGIVDNRKVRWNTVNSVKLDQKRLKEEQREIYDKYCYTASYRRFSII